MTKISACMSNNPTLSSKEIDVIRAWMQTQWERIPAVPHSQPGSYARGYDGGLVDVLRGLQATLDKLPPALETSDARDAARYRYIRNCLHCPETDLLITSRSKAPAECGVYSTNILDAIVDDAIKATSQKANSCSYCEAGEPRTADGFHRKAEGRYAKCTAVSA